MASVDGVPVPTGLRLTDVTADMVLAEIPMPAASSVADMYFSTSHWARLVNGDSGYWPASYTALKNDMDAFPTQALLAQLRQRRATHISVNCRLFADPSTCGCVLAAVEEMPDLQRVSSARWEGADVRLYKLR